MVDARQRSQRPESTRCRDERGAVLLLALLFVFVVSLVVLATTAWEGNDLKNAATFANERSALYGTGGATQTAIAVVGVTPPTETTSALPAGSYSSLNVTALPEAIPSGTTIVIGTIPTTPTQSLTVSSAANAGDTVIHVSSFTVTAAGAQPAGTLVNLGLCPGGGPATMGTGAGSISVTVWCSVVLFPQLTPPDPSITREVTFSACPSTISQANCTSVPYVNAVVDYDDYNTSNQLQCTALSPATSASCGTGVTLRIWAVSGR